MDKKFDKSKLVEFLACPTGFEPAASRVGVSRAIQLCHGQIYRYYSTDFSFLQDCGKRKRGSVIFYIVVNHRIMYAQSRLSRSNNLRTMFAQPQMESFCGAFFKKRQRKTAFSFCEAFSFALMVSKEKAKE